MPRKKIAVERVSQVSEFRTSCGFQNSKTGQIRNFDLFFALQERPTFFAVEKFFHRGDVLPTQRKPRWVGHPSPLAPKGRSPRPSVTVAEWCQIEKERGK